MPLVSFVIPAHRAEATVGRTVRGCLSQGVDDVEVIVVSDDGRDYAAVLAAEGIADPRLRFATTGGVGTGCWRARNAGLALASGSFVSHLDADDEILAHRLMDLLPIAARAGAAADNLLIVDDATGREIGRPLPDLDVPVALDMTAFFQLDAPLVPVMRRELAEPRLEGAEFSEDVIANIRLIERIGRLPVVPRASYVYRVRAGSLAHDETSADRFDMAYGAYLARLEAGDGLGLTAAGRRTAIAGFSAKRALNRAYDDACRSEPTLDFQTFVAQLRAAAPDTVMAAGAA